MDSQLSTTSFTQRRLVPAGTQWASLTTDDKAEISKEVGDHSTFVAAKKLGLVPASTQWTSLTTDDKAGIGKEVGDHSQFVMAKNTGILPPNAIWNSLTPAEKAAFKKWQTDRMAHVTAGKMDKMPIGHVSGKDTDQGDMHTGARSESMGVVRDELLDAADTRGREYQKGDDGDVYSTREQAKLRTQVGAFTKKFPRSSGKKEIMLKFLQEHGCPALPGSHYGQVTEQLIAHRTRTTITALRGLTPKQARSWACQRRTSATESMNRTVATMASLRAANKFNNAKNKK